MGKKKHMCEEVVTTFGVLCCCCVLASSLNTLACNLSNVSKQVHVITAEDAFVNKYI